MVRSGKISMECDDKCRDVSESKKKDEEKKAKDFEAEELKKQQVN